MPINLLTLFITFVNAGGLVIGDGYAVITPLRQALVKKTAWMDDESFTRCLTTVQTMPGIFNINLAAYVGKQLAGWRGAIVCMAGMTLPALCIFAVFATFYEDFCAFPAIHGFLRGARPALVALIALPCIQMWKKSGISLSTVWIPVGAAIGIGLLGISPAYIIGGFIFMAMVYALLTHNN